MFFVVLVLMPLFLSNVLVCSDICLTLTELSPFVPFGFVFIVTDPAVF